jgi:Na+/serine symporter
MDATQSSSSWSKSTLSTGMNASNDYRAYVVLVLCAMLGWALLVLVGHFSRKNHFPLNDKVAKDPVSFFFFSFLFTSSLTCHD